MMRTRHPTGSGVTLVEMMVVLFVLGLLASAAALSIVNVTRPRQPSSHERLETARARAILTGERVLVSVDGADSGAGSVLFLPDGRAVGPGLDPLTGLVTDATR